MISSETSTTKKPDGTVVEKRKWSVEPEDILAVGAVLVALLVIAGMIFGALPVNKYTYGLAGLSVAGAAIAKIVKARKGAPKKE